MLWLLRRRKRLLLCKEKKYPPVFLLRKNPAPFRQGGPVKYKTCRVNPGRFLLYKENHALDAWFNKAYGGE